MDGSVNAAALSSTALTPLVKVEEIHHSKVGASGAERWMNCTGSNNLIRKIVAAGGKLRKVGGEAALGTAAHTICQICLESGEESWERMGTKLTVSDWTFECDQEMANSVQMYLTYIRGLIEKYKDFDPVLYVEKGMGTILDPDAYGTSDCILHVRKLKLLFVIDFKNGMVCVEPNYPQPKYYGALAIENMDGAQDVEKVILVIVQPRMPHPKGRIRTHEMTANEISTWFEREAVVKMAETRLPDAPLVIGKWCRFCEARDDCPAMKGELTNFDVSIEPDAMTDEELGRILVKIDIFERQFQRMKEEALQRALNGHKILYHKLVKKKANRVFKRTMVVTDPETGAKVTVGIEEAARAKWNDEAFTKPTLLSPAQMEEKLDGGKGFVTLWGYSPESGLTLAGENDKREAHVPLMQKLDEQLAEERLAGVDIPE